MGVKAGSGVAEVPLQAGRSAIALALSKSAWLGYSLELSCIFYKRFYLSFHCLQSRLEHNEIY